MTKKTHIILCIGLILLAMPGSSMATVNINVDVNVPPPPPPLLLPAPPDVFVIPGTYAYFPPAVDIDIIFYGGYWYRPHRGYWYRSSSYNGKWAYVEIERLPRGIRTLPPDWRSVPPGHRHIPYGHMKKSWRTWERDKYWEKHEWKHEEKERHREYKEHRKQEKHKYKGKKYDD